MGKSPYEARPKGRTSFQTVGIPLKTMEQIDAWAAREVKRTGTPIRSRNAAVNLMVLRVLAEASK